LHTPFALKIIPDRTTLCWIHADDDNNPLLPYSLHTASSLVYVVICNLLVFCK